MAWMDLMKGWVCGVLLDDASLGLGHEVEDVVDFRDLGKRFADFLQALFAQLAALVEEAVGIVDMVDDFGRAQSRSGEFVHRDTQAPEQP